MGHVRLVTEQEGFWFKPEGTDSRFRLRRLDPDVLEEIEARYRKPERLRSGERIYPIRPEDRIEQAKDILDYVIIEWDGPIGGDGKPATCTRDTKAKLPGSIKVQILEQTDASALPDSNGSDPTRA